MNMTNSSFGILVLCLCTLGSCSNNRTNSDSDSANLYSGNNEYNTLNDQGISKREQEIRNRYPFKQPWNVLDYMCSHTFYADGITLKVGSDKCLYVNDQCISTVLQVEDFDEYSATVVANSPYGRGVRLVVGQMTDLYNGHFEKGCVIDVYDGTTYKEDNWK